MCNSSYQAHQCTAWRGAQTRTRFCSRMVGSWWSSRCRPTPSRPCGRPTRASSSRWTGTLSTTSYCLGLRTADTRSGETGNFHSRLKVMHCEISKLLSHRKYSAFILYHFLINLDGRYKVLGHKNICCSEDLTYVLCLALNKTIEHDEKKKQILDIQNLKSYVIKCFRTLCIFSIIILKLNCHNCISLANKSQFIVSHICNCWSSSSFTAYFTLQVWQDIPNFTLHWCAIKSKQINQTDFHSAVAIGCLLSLINNCCWSSG